MKKLKNLVLFIGLFTVLCLCLMLNISAVVETGECGENVTYSFDTETKHLVISGEGKMKDYPYGDFPAWQGRIKSVEIKQGVTGIGKYSFHSCYDLETVSIPASVTTLGYYPFTFCNRIKSFYVDENNEYFSSDEYGALFNKDKSVLIRYPSGNSRKSYTIPDGVKTLETQSLYYSENLTEIIIPGSVTNINTNAISYCSNIKEITLPEGVSVIGDNAFYHNRSLEIVNLPSTVSKIDKYAFHECNKLHTVNYAGTDAQWKNIDISREGNGMLIAAKNGFAQKTVITATKNGENYLEISWAPVSGAYGYRVFIKEYGASNWLSCGIPSTRNLTETIHYLTPGKKYIVAVRAYAVADRVVWAPTYSTAVTATSPSPVSEIKDKHTLESVTLSWDKVNCSGYRVFKYNPDTKKWDIAVRATNATSVKITGLEKNKKYIFAVRPYINTGTQIIWSKTYTKVTTSTMLPEVAFKVSSTSKGRAKITWDKSEGATGYQVWYSTNETTGYKKIGNFTKTSTYKYNLTSGKTYYFKVRAYTKVGNTYVYSPFTSAEAVKIK